MKHQALIILACILACIFASAPFIMLFVNYSPRSVEKPAIFHGTVIDVGPHWTMNGDGELTLRVAKKTHYYTIRVCIVGACNTTPETQIELTTVRFIQDLPGHSIDVCGKLITDQYDRSYIIASHISE